MKKNSTKKVSKMKQFEEKNVKDLSTIKGGTEQGPGISFSLNWGGWFDGSLFHGNINEFDR